jgi:hypothetical protein
MGQSLILAMPPDMQTALRALIFIVLGALARLIGEDAR